MKKWAFGGLRFGVPVTTLKINKMTIFGWISFKFGIYHKILHDKYFSKKTIFGPGSGQNRKKL